MTQNQNMAADATVSNKPANCPARSVIHSPEKFLICVGHMLSSLVQQTPVSHSKDSKFYCKTKPSISICDYLKRIYRFAACSQYIYLKALIYIDRFQQKREDFYVNQYSIHRLLMCTIMIAAKYSEDFYYTNKHYSKVGGISEEDINKLQREFLESVDYALYVDRDELFEYEQKLNTYYDRVVCADDQVSKWEQSPTRTEGAPIAR